MKKTFLSAALAALLALPCAAQAGDSTFVPSEPAPSALDITAVPVGTVHAWAESSAAVRERNAAGHPVWLECNGNAFDPSLYPKLYMALASDVLPDYRSAYLIGYGTNGENPALQSGPLGVREEARPFAHAHGVNRTEGFGERGSGHPLASISHSGGTASLNVTGREAGTAGGSESFDTEAADEGKTFRPRNMAVRWYVKASE